ncbi:hypothetical protein TESG_05962 [Trichophyton tonsurans CBS 112818]|uniref:Uncharacterized protein n=1 Tax=Trichophyton tonsurans (strain CBS 112818) TaxID=647933 RepID=F2S4P2_TRIT1|nr:hypothetical protein TESG_05962 [Trichophyton tonsurans CBS 112818]
MLCALHSTYQGQQLLNTIATFLHSSVTLLNSISGFKQLDPRVCRLLSPLWLDFIFYPVLSVILPYPLFRFIIEGTDLMSCSVYPWIAITLAKGILSIGYGTSAWKRLSFRFGIGYVSPPFIPVSQCRFLPQAHKIRPPSQGRRLFLPFLEISLVLGRKGPHGALCPLQDYPTFPFSILSSGCFVRPVGRRPPTGSLSKWLRKALLHLSAPRSSFRPSKGSLLVGLKTSI